MAGIAIGIVISSEAQARIDAYKGLDAAIARHLDGGLTQWLNETVTDIQVNDFRGGPGAGGGQTPIGVRSGQLRQDLHAGGVEFLAGYIGTTGVTVAYARATLGDGETTITPKSAKHLWIPIADNLNPSGNARLSPKAAMSLRTSTGKRALRIFTSRRGNLVAFLPGEVDKDGGFRAQKGRYARGAKKGQQRGKLLFVLKDEVTVKGTDALVRGVKRTSARGQVILTSAVQAAFREVVG